MADITLKNLEKELLKNGRASCPNTECQHSIVSEEKEGRAGSSFLEYWCENETCSYHKKRIINISIGKSLVEQIQSGFSVLGKRAITGLVGVFLVIGATLGNFIPKMFGIEGEGDEKLEQIKSENETLKAQINTLLTKQNNGGKAEPLVIDPEAKDQKVAALEKEINDLKAMMAVLPLCESELKGMIKEAEKLMKVDDPSNAKKIFERIYTDPRVKNAFLAPENNPLRRKMVGRFADSYTNTLNRFTYEYLKDATSFKFFQDFIKTFPVPAQDIYLGKAFYNFPNYVDGSLSFKESKRYQLIGVKHYLMAARDNRCSLSDTHVLSAMNNVLELYQLFKFKNKDGSIPENYVTIESAIQDRNVIILKKRIDEIQKLIDKLEED